MALQLLAKFCLLEARGVSNDPSSQTQPVPTTLPEEEVKTPLKTESRVARLLQVFTPQKKASKQPSATPEATARPVIGSRKGALFLDIAGKIVSVQPHCASYFGWKPEELTRLNLKDLLAPDSGDELTNLLQNGRQAGVQSFPAVALRKDGSEFSTQLAFKFIPGNYGYSWTVFVQAPPGHSDPIDPKSANGHNDSREPKATVAPSETPKPQSAEKPAAGAVAGPQNDSAKPARKSPPEPNAQSHTEESTVNVEQELQCLRIRAEENETTREVLVQDLERVRNSNKLLRKKEDELNAQVRKLQLAVQQAEVRARESAGHSKDWEQKAADYRKEIDELTAAQIGGQNADARAARQRVKELERRLKDADANVVAAKTVAEKLEAENRQLKEAHSKTRAELKEERDANKIARQITEDLNARVKKLQADTGNNADVQSDQRVQQFEQQLNESNASLTAARAEAEKQNSARQRLEAENRNLAETNAKAQADLEKERDAKKLAQEQKEELHAQVEKLKGAAEPSAQRVKELEKQLKGAGDDLAASKAELEKQHSMRQRLEAENRKLAESNTKTVADLEKDRHAKKVAQEQKEEFNAQVEKLKIAAEQSAQRVKELEQQLKRAADDLAASKAEIEKQNAAHQRPEAPERDAVLDKLVGELEASVREGLASVAKANAEAENHRLERQRAEKSAASAAAQLAKLEEKLKRQAESERASQAKITELEKTIRDRGDDLARASAALRKEAKQRQVAQNRSRLVSEMGTRLESNLASLDEAKKTFEISLQTLEGSLADANSSLEKESAERRRLEGLLADAKQQLVKLSAESKVEIVKLQKLSAESRVEISRLQAALHLEELQRKRLEADSSRSRVGAEEPELRPAAKPDNTADSRKPKSK